MNGATDSFVLVGGDVWADSENTYLRGLELISSDDYFYLYNIRGDVIQLLDYDGEVVKTYDYDAYGNELNRDLSDENPFRYCGEYYDVETGFVYLRARYYDPNIGRFTSKDIHWNPYNSIYGDNPVKTLNSDDCTSYYPDELAIKQSNNQYAYCTNNPIAYRDSNGLFVLTTTALLIIGGVLLGATAGGLVGNHIANKNGLEGWEKAGYIAAWTIGGGFGGAMLGYVAAPTVMAYTGVSSLSISSTGIVAFGVTGGTIISQSSALSSSQISQMINQISHHRAYEHIMLPKHLWDTVGANSWDSVKQIIHQTLQYGRWYESLKTQGNYIYHYVYDGRIIEVVLRYMNDAYTIVDAWVKDV